MLLGIALGAGAIVHARGLLVVREPPPVSAEPVLAVALEPGERIPWMTRSEYRVRASVSGCRNPVALEFEAVIHGEQQPEPSVARRGYVHGVIVDPLHAIRSFRLFVTDGAFPQSWKKAKPLTMRRQGDRLFFGAPLRLWLPASVMVGMAAASTQRAVTVRAAFEADWVLPRSSKTCFVRFPTLQTPIVDPLNPPSTTQWAPTPGPAAVTVVSTSGATVNAQASIPPPTDPRIPLWRCASTAVSIENELAPTGGAGNCGGVAVFSKPGADAHVALWLLIDGALIGLAAALFAESAIRFRWPLAPDRVR